MWLFLMEKKGKFQILEIVQSFLQWFKILFPFLCENKLIFTLISFKIWKI